MSRTTRQTRTRTASTPLGTNSTDNEETVATIPKKLKDGLVIKKRKKSEVDDINVVTTSTRTSSRRRTVTNEVLENDDNDNNNNNEDENEIEEEDDELATTTAQFTVNGIIYNTYQEMVQAKRERNQKMLEESGLLSSVSTMKQELNNNNRRKTTINGIKGLQAKTLKERSTSNTTLLPPRKSSRLAGIIPDTMYVDKERGNTFEFGGLDNNVNSSSTTTTTISAPSTFYSNRINDGSALTISDVVSLTGSKWCKSNSISLAETFTSGTLRNEIISSSSSFTVKEEDEAVVATSPINTTSDSTRTSRQRKAITPSPTLSDSTVMDESNNDKCNNKKFRQYFPYTDNQRQQLLSLSCNDDSTCSFAKVVPERIYGIAVHPSKNNVIVSAGDKVGHIGIWNVDHVSANNNTPETTISNDNTTNDTTGNSKTKTDSDGVYLFKYHSGAAVSLQWTDDGSALVSTSYDGTIRWLDIEKQISEQIFATYDDNDDSNKHQLGYGLHMGYKFWTQYGCIDHRSTSNKCIFVSTSIGTVLHLDVRTHDKQRITFHEDLSEKKVNTVSLHPNGYSLMTGGLDNTIRVWDIRKFGDSRLQTTASKKKTTIPVAQWQCSKSISSAYFSPSGQYSVATSMDDKLEIFENIHLSSTNTTNNVKPITRYNHDNRTGRWLSTFMANYHPTIDIFVVGSMMKPRSIDLFDHTGTKCISKIQSLSGDNLSAVNSRCCFHPRTDKIIIAGGNSSGRVTVVR